MRREANCKTTFVIAKLCEGKEYMYAAAFGVAVVSETWVFDAWENRNIVGFNAAELSFVSFANRRPPSLRLKIPTDIRLRMLTNTLDHLLDGYPICYQSVAPNSR